MNEKTKVIWSFRISRPCYVCSIIAHHHPPTQTYCWALNCKKFFLKPWSVCVTNLSKKIRLESALPKGASCLIIPFSCWEIPRKKLGQSEPSCFRVKSDPLSQVCGETQAPVIITSLDLNWRTCSRVHNETLDRTGQVATAIPTGYKVKLYYFFSWIFPLILMRHVHCFKLH